MKQAFFWCYPWDIEDEGIDAPLERMAGEIGANAVSVIAAYHGLIEFRSRDISGPRTIEREAAAHFQPESKRYINTRVRPVAGSWMKSRNPLRKIATVAEKLGLKLRLLASCCRSETLIARYPMASCVDVFGDPIYARLCPSNPDVREYVASLAEDLTTNYPADTLELDEVGFGSLPQQHRWGTLVGFLMDDADSALRSWCFCPSCRQRAADAGIDMATVTATVKDRLSSTMLIQTRESKSYNALMSHDANLAAYHAMRVETVASLVKMVRDRVSTRLILHVGPSHPSAGFDVTALSPHCDGFIVPWEQTDASGKHADVPREYTDALGKHTGDGRASAPTIMATEGPERIETAHFCFPPHANDAAALVAQVHEATGKGCAGVGFFNYGIAPEPCLDWVRQAIRYARREYPS